MTLEQLHSAFPDWTNKSQYPDPKQFSLSQWAWEFLRRNPKYQADYAAIELETNPNERARKFRQAGTAYGLNRPLIDPRTPATELKDYIFQDGTPRIIGVSTRPFQISEFQAAVVIDLRLPIDAQLKLAGPRLCEEQFRFDMSKKQPALATHPDRPYKRAQPEKYSGYLRVLDAKRTPQITFQQIAEIVFPHLTDMAGAKLAGSAYKAAVAIRDGNYRVLPLFAVPEIDY